MQRDHERDLCGRCLRGQSRLRQRCPYAPPLFDLFVDLGIELGAEARELFELQKLGVLQPQGADRLAHQWRLRLATHAAHAQARVHGGQLPQVKLLGIQHDLPVGDGDQVGGYVGRQVAGFGLRNGQGGERTTAALGRQHGGALEQARVQMEHVARVGFPTRRLLHQQSQLAVGGGVFAQVVDHHQGMLPTVAEIFGHREAGKGREPLQARCGGAGRDDEDRALGCPQSPHRIDHSRRGLRLLPHRDVHADQFAVALGQQCIQRHRGFAGAAVTDDEFALSAAQREQCINGQRAGVHGLAHEGPFDDVGRRAFSGQMVFGLNGRALVQRAAQRVNHAAEQAWADRNLHHAAAARDALAGAHAVGLVEQHTGDVVGFQARRITHAVLGKVQQLIEPHTRQPGDLGDAIGNAVHTTDFLESWRGQRPGRDARPGGRAPGLEYVGERGFAFAHGLACCMSARAAANSADQLCDNTPCSKCSSAPRSREGRVSARKTTGAPSALLSCSLTLCSVASLGALAQTRVTGAGWVSPSQRWRSCAGVALRCSSKASMKAVSPSGVGLLSIRRVARSTAIDEASVIKV